MAYKYSFADNEIYSADDLNAITKRLVTSGIEDSFEDGTAYNVSRFNEQGKLLYTSGIVPETCMTLKVVPDGEGKVLINPGRAFFDDGAVIEIEAGGESLSYVADIKNYVYLKNDLLNNNICFPACSTEEPTGDYVLLAEIDETGKITDKRTYAKGRLPGYQSVVGNVMRLKETITINTEKSSSILDGSASFDIGDNNFEYILAYREYEPKKETYGPTYGTCLGIYDIANDHYRNFNTSDEKKNDKRLAIQRIQQEYYQFHRSVYAKFELENNILTVFLHVFDSYKDFPAGAHSFDIDLILF